jgi:hypothetical protein
MLTQIKQQGWTAVAITVLVTVSTVIPWAFVIDDRYARRQEAEQTQLQLQQLRMQVAELTGMVRVLAHSVERGHRVMAAPPPPAPPSLHRHPALPAPRPNTTMPPSLSPLIRDIERLQKQIQP